MPHPSRPLLARGWEPAIRSPKGVTIVARHPARHSVCPLWEIVVTFVLRNAFSPRPCSDPQNRMGSAGVSLQRCECPPALCSRDSEPACGPQQGPLKISRPGTCWSTDKCLVRNTLLISALNRILCVESRKVLSSKDLRLPVNRLL